MSLKEQMNPLSYSILIVIPLLLLTACDFISDPHLNQEFKVRNGEGATIKDEGLKVTFQSVLADSRCPKGWGVVCAWTGEAKISVTVQHTNHAAEIFEMILNPGPVKREIISYADYEIRLKALNPYPEAGKRIDAEDYEAVFVVRKK